MFKARFFLAAALLTFATLLSATSAFAFEIAVYQDPLSDANYHFLADHRQWYSGSYQNYLTNVFHYDQSQMDSAYKWYQEMGVTKVMVDYIDPWDFSQIPNDTGMAIKVMNWNFPGSVGMRGDKYVDAQYRDVYVGDYPSNWSFLNSIGSGASRVTVSPPIVPDERTGVRMSDSPGTLWQPSSDLGSFSGWDYCTTGWLDSSICMPMHFRLTWAVDPQGTIDTLTPLANFYWIVQAPNDTIRGVPYTRWWQYPVKPLTLPHLSDVNSWITTELVDSSKAGFYDLLDDSFRVIGSFDVDGLHSGPASPPHSLDDWDLAGVPVGPRTAVRMKVEHMGTHDFYLNRIEVYDEGAYRMYAAHDTMFAAHDSIYYDSLIWRTFKNEIDSSYGKSCGWYYDEWDVSGSGNGNPVLRSIVKVNRLLQDHGLPTMFIQGEPGWHGCTNCYLKDLFDELDHQSVNEPIHMDEFYLFGDRRACSPIIRYMKTDASSDVTYFQTRDTCNGDNVHAIQSLQASIDEHIFGDAAIVAAHSLPIAPDWATDHYSLLSQVAYVHEDASRKFWALIQGDDDVIGDTTDPNSFWNIRQPTPNEVKLSAWLAVACNVDGIMWYPWNFGGLLEWTNSSHSGIRTTDRYDSAKTACNEILKVERTLESLPFVKTYASRAYETDYPNSTYPATAYDTLAMSTNPTLQLRYVSQIQTFDTASGTPDEHPYVQVSRFRNPQIPLYDPILEDYWFLIVNRRALPDETRKVRLVVETDPAFRDNPYYIYHVLGDSLVSEPCRNTPCSEHYVEVVLAPGEGQLVHFYRGEFGCDSTHYHIQNLTALRYSPNTIRLTWEAVTETDSGETFEVDSYFVYG